MFAHTHRISCLCVRDVCSCRAPGRLVNVYMNQYFCPAAIEEPNFLLSELKEYYVPPDGDLQSYKASRLPTRAVDTNRRLGCYQPFIVTLPLHFFFSPFAPRVARSHNLPYTIIIKRLFVSRTLDRCQRASYICCCLWGNGRRICGAIRLLCAHGRSYNL